MITKTCSKCAQDLPLSAYHLDRRRADGRRARCKACRAHHQCEKYGVKRSYVDYLLDMQHEKCAACKQDLSGSWCIHHRHEGGHVTALLCSVCNRIEGLVRRHPHVVAFMMWEQWVVNAVDEIRILPIKEHHAKH